MGLANGLKLPAHVADIGTQAASLAAMLGILAVVRAANAGCGARRARVSTALASLLTLSLVARVGALPAAQQSRFGRWDATAASLAFVATATMAYFAIAPPGKRWTVGYLGLLLVGLPLVTALPLALRRSANAPAEVVRAAARAARDSYSRETLADAGTDTSALVVPAGEVAYVAFRGTSSRTDVRTDAAVGSAAWPGSAGARVHRGFFAAYASVRDRLRAALAAASPAPRELVFTGHSLGGALATLAALDFATTTAQPTVTCVTFGAPQCGDAAFVALFDAAVPRAARVVNPLDLVPRSLSSQFEHTKGYAVVSSWAPPVNFLATHGMAGYVAGVDRPQWLNWVLLAAVQPGYALLAVLAVLAASRRLQRTK